MINNLDLNFHKFLNIIVGLISKNIQRKIQEKIQK